MLYKNYLFFLVIFPWLLHGQIHKNVKMLSEELVKTEFLLSQPLTDTSIKIIENQLTQANAKIAALAKELPTSSEKGNPFLPGFIDEIKKKIESLESSFILQKRALLPMHIAHEDSTILQLLNEWNEYKMQSIDYFAAKTSNEQKDLYAIAAQQRQQQQATFSSWYQRAAQLIEQELKQLQNDLFDFTQSYQDNCDKAFDEIITAMNQTPPVPKRTSSLVTKQAPIPPISLEESILVKEEEAPAPPTVEKNIWQKTREEAEKAGQFFTKKTEELGQTIKETAEKAKEYATQHLSSIEKQLRELQEPEIVSTPSPMQSTQKTQQSTLPNPSFQSGKINNIVNLIFESQWVYRTLKRHGIYHTRFYTCMSFLDFCKLDPFDSSVFRLRGIANNIITMLEKIFAHVHRKEREIYRMNQFYGDLYRHLFVLPTVFYSMLIGKKLAWLSDKAAMLYKNSKFFLKEIAKYQKKHQHALLFNQEEQKKYAISAYELAKNKNRFTREDLLPMYMFLQTITLITGKDDATIQQLRLSLSTQALHLVLTAKNNILSFMHVSLFKSIQSPFPLAKELLNDLFMRLEAFQNITPLLLLEETQGTMFHLWSTKDFKQVDIATLAIYNAFETCAKKAKERAQKENNLTATNILYEQLERILILIKPYAPTNK